MILAPVWSHYKTGVRSARKWNQNSSHFKIVCTKIIFSLVFSLLSIRILVMGINGGFFLFFRQSAGYVLNAKLLRRTLFLENTDFQVFTLSLSQFLTFSVFWHCFAQSFCIAYSLKVYWANIVIKYHWFFFARTFLIALFFCSVLRK